jgi:hypothetical protein
MQNKIERQKWASDYLGEFLAVQNVIIFILQISSTRLPLKLYKLISWLFWPFHFYIVLIIITST